MPGHMFFLIIGSDTQHLSMSRRLDAAIPFDNGPVCKERFLPRIGTETQWSAAALQSSSESCAANVGVRVKYTIMEPSRFKHIYTTSALHKPKIKLYDILICKVKTMTVTV